MDKNTDSYDKGWLVYYRNTSTCKHTLSLDPNYGIFYMHISDARMWSLIHLPTGPTMCLNPTTVTVISRFD